MSTAKEQQKMQMTFFENPIQCRDLDFVLAQTKKKIDVQCSHTSFQAHNIFIIVIFVFIFYFILFFFSSESFIRQF